jgi:hypothetical protein
MSDKMTSVKSNLKSCNYVDFGFGFAELAFGSVRIFDFGFRIFDFGLYFLFKSAIFIHPHSQIRNPQYT